MIPPHDNDADHGERGDGEVDPQPRLGVDRRREAQNIIQDEGDDEAQDLQHEEQERGHGGVEALDGDERGVRDLLLVDPIAHCVGQVCKALEVEVRQNCEHGSKLLNSAVLGLYQKQRKRGQNTGRIHKHLQRRSKRNRYPRFSKPSRTLARITEIQCQSRSRSTTAPSPSFKRK